MSLVARFISQHPLVFSGILLLVIALLYFQVYSQPESKVIEKWNLAQELLKKQKIHYIAIPISGSRTQVWNRILPLAASDSPHLRGHALDLFILPASAIPHVLSALESVEAANPELAGGIGAYQRNNAWNLMIHIDIERTGVRWGYDNYPDMPPDFETK